MELGNKAEKNPKDVTSLKPMPELLSFFVKLGVGLQVYRHLRSRGVARGQLKYMEESANKATLAIFIESNTPSHLYD